MYKIIYRYYLHCIEKYTYINTMAREIKITAGEKMRENLKIVSIIAIAVTFLFLVISNDNSNTVEDQIKYYNIKTQLNK